MENYIRAQKNDRASKRVKTDATQSQSSKVCKKMHVNAVMEV
ncbi:hypothetical protein EM595_p1112 (plasmid) [Duffyella gerundensis]|uniref:Uncharacterized protein n=1 Tax=Duffyella gerundensis TaxID=1619313 RepID=A0A0U5LC83_9GAMM|nr:hypothetical protein EM595_p1112 [Duffyella gerundensis]